MYKYINLLNIFYFKNGIKLYNIFYIETMENSNTWKIINKLFEDNPQCLVRHHIESYNDFYKNGLIQIFKENNPVQIQSRYDDKINDYRSKCIMYMGGINGDKIYYGKPVIYEDNSNDLKSHYMYPNEARLRNMTYGITIHYDIDIEFIDILEDGEAPTVIGHEDLNLDDLDEIKPIVGGNPIKRQGRKKKKYLEITPAELGELKEHTLKTVNKQNTQIRTITIEKILLGKFPIMIQSNYCILSGLPKEVRHSLGECVNDIGGYFIIGGKEKTVVPQEKTADNILNISKSNDDKYLYVAEIRSVSENVSKPIRKLAVKIMSPTNKYTFNNIVVSIPNVRKPVPLFIVFRALGIISDKEIITMCLLDIEKHKDMVDLFIPSIHDAGCILTQRNAIKYIALLTKGLNTTHTLELLCDYFLPHVGEYNFKQKAYYLGYIVFRLLSVYSGIEEPTDRDNFKNKRIELVGDLLYDLFREYYNAQLKYVHTLFDSIIHFNQSIYANNLYGLINTNYRDVFRYRVVEDGFNKAFKGNWGMQAHTKRIGIVQDLNRLSFNSALSHLRKTNLHMDPTAKVVAPRALHCTQWGFFDPIDTPDGGNIGLHKHLSIAAHITLGYSNKPLINWMRKHTDMKLIEDCSPIVLSTMTKVLINGLWVGSITKPYDVVSKFKLYRRNGLIPIYTSISFDIKYNNIFIQSDSGRLCRPVFYYDEYTNKMSYMNYNFINKLDNNKFSWDELVTGFNTKNNNSFSTKNNVLYELNELYDTGDETNPAMLKAFLSDKAIIDYIDTNETDSALIALNADSLNNKKQKYTHMEIHESLIFGTMTNLICFPENNPATRNSFSCGQSKQACSIYHTNHRVRMDKTAIVLNSGQTPLVKSHYVEHIGDNPYGENTIVAVMCYTGYNVEDAILINEGAIKRGLFRTTYYSTYETHEEKKKTSSTTQIHAIANIEDHMKNIVNTKKGYDYSKLDKHGIIKMNTELTDKTILVGMASYDEANPIDKTDMSKGTKKGQLGIVDTTFITDGDDGTRIAKVRIREERIPNIGDKMASRAGQKGTIGLVIPEADMPFTKDGLRPDIIINPHAIPSRMTIGQFVETITGKACAMYGAFGDCTAYNNKGSKVGIFGKLLTNVGYHSSGNDVLYNGMTGEQLETEIFIGPNYYMRLKHMVKDKINYRALGPRTALTRQPVSGRANDGGLRIGEMERDSVISHGISEFLRESMMERSDNYKMAICNNSGMMAIYNTSNNVFLSPMADGPIKFSGTLKNNSMRIETISKYGRNFSIVNVPYAFKLLMQELLAVNISMRIITEDNIDQIENMAFSNNINLLSKNINRFSKNIRTNIEKIIDQINMQLSEPTDTKSDTSIPAISHDTKSDTSIPAISHDSIDTLLPDNLNNIDSPPYNPHDDDSPPYNPHDDDSPPYNPHDDNQHDDNDNNLKVSNQPQWLDSPINNNELIQPPPPPQNTDVLQKGGETEKNDDSFTQDELVHYRRDNKANRLWRIKKITDSFITIETDDNEGLTPIDMIKVVTSIDIYKQNNYTDSFSNIPQNDKNPVINFQPIISINNGQKDKIDDLVEIDNIQPPSIKVKQTDDNEQIDNYLPPTDALTSGEIIVKKT